MGEVWRRVLTLRASVRAWSSDHSGRDESVVALLHGQSSGKSSNQVAGVPASPRWGAPRSRPPGGGAKANLGKNPRSFFGFSQQLVAPKTLLRYNLSRSSFPPNTQLTRSSMGLTR